MSLLVLGLVRPNFVLVVLLSFGVYIFGSLTVHQGAATPTATTQLMTITDTTATSLSLSICIYIYIYATAPAAEIAAQCYRHIQPPTRLLQLLL